MNLLRELAALAALRDRAGSVAAYQRVLAEAWEGLERILADGRFPSLRTLLGVPSAQAARALLDELTALRRLNYEVPGTLDTGGGEAARRARLASRLEGAGYPATAALLRRDHPLLFELAGMLLGGGTVTEHELDLGEVIAEEAFDDDLDDDFDDSGVVLGEGEDFELSLDEEPEESARVVLEEETLTLEAPAEPTPAPVPRPAGLPAPARTRREAARYDEEDEDEEERTYRRRASVRWYRRMNPMRMYPLTVVLAQGRLREVRKPAVGQATAKEQIVVTNADPFVRIRPVLPGCLCFPDEQVVDATAEMVEVRFQVLPQMLGTVEDARVEFFQGHRRVATVELPIVVSRQTAAVVFASLGLAWPLLGPVLKSVGGAGNGDSKELLERGLSWAVAQPHALEFGLLLGAVAAVICWWWNRPKQSTVSAGLGEVQPMTVAELIQAGQAALARGDRAEARGCAEDALNLDPTNAAAADLLRRSRD